MGINILRRKIALKVRQRVVKGEQCAGVPLGEKIFWEELSREEMT